jgi:hypothetical protein
MKKSFFLIFSILLISLVFAAFALAQDCPSGSVCIGSPLKYKTFPELIDYITNIVFIVALAVAPIPILLAGYNFITSQGDPKKIQTAKSIILYTLIGLGIVFFARAIQGILKLVTEIK